MGYIQTITNEEGEILGTETVYEDEYSEEDFYDRMDDLDYDYDEPDSYDDGFENDLGDEWNS